MDAVSPVGAGQDLVSTGNLPRDIHSAVTDSEAHTLADLASDRVVLEVGSHWGFSTVVMARVAEIVHSVDWHRGDDHAGWADSFSEFQGNLDRYLVRDRVVMHVGACDDVLPVLRPRHFGLVFLDGAHDFASAERDIEYAVQLVSPSGVIALHDWGRFDVADAYRNVTDRPVNSVIDSLAIVKAP